MKTFLHALAAMAMVLVGVISAPLWAAPVTGFSYQLPRLPRPDPALSRYFQQDRAKVYRDYAALFSDPDNADQDFSSFESSTNWTMDSALPGVTVFVVGRSSFTGGAHGFAYVDAMIWDHRIARPIPFAQLFTNADAAKTLLARDYCRALNRERMTRREGSTDPSDLFGDCPDLFREAVVYPTKPVYGKYSRIAISLAPYVAGPYSEGIYDLELFIPKGLKALAKPQYQALFPG